MLWSIKNKSKLKNCLLLCINLVRILWRPADSNDAVLTIISDGGQGIVDIDTEVGKNKLITRLIHNIILNPLMAASANPFRRGSRGWGMLAGQNHAAGGANGSIIVGMYVSVCFAS